MARTDVLIPGSIFFLVHYFDDDLLIPSIQTLKFIERTTLDDGAPIWLFRELSSGDGAEDPAPPLVGVREAQIYQLLDLDGLVRVVNELRLVNRKPAIPIGPAIAVDDLPGGQGLSEHIKQFCCQPVYGSLHVKLRYTDRGFFVERTSRGFAFQFYMLPFREPEESNRLQNLVKNRGLKASVDYLADLGRTRFLKIPAPSDFAEISLISKEVLTDVYRMRIDDEIQFVEIT
jgi:hypothetical protein